MSEEIEVPLEKVQEKLIEDHHKAHGHAEGTEVKDWTRFVALSTALLAVIAAIGALQSGLLVNEALVQKNEQIGKLTQASDQWNYYQAEGLKALIYTTAAQPLPPGSPDIKYDAAQAKSYKAKQAAITAAAKELFALSETARDESEKYLSRHHIFAFSVSLCQVAIALSAIAALTRRKRVWIVGMVAGGAGTVLLLWGFWR